MKYLCKVIKKPRLLDLQESDKEYQKLLLEPNYFLPKEPIKNNIEPDISKEPFYCYPLESNFTGAKPNPYSSISFFKMMAKLCKIDSKLNKKKIIEEIKKKIPYLYSNRKEQNIQALKDFTIEDKKRSRKGNSRKQKKKTKKKSTSKSKKAKQKRDNLIIKNYNLVKYIDVFVFLYHYYLFYNLHLITHNYFL